MNLLLAVIYFPVFALFFSVCVVWILERGEKKYGMMKNYNDMALLAGAFTFFIVYAFNVLVSISRVFNFYGFQVFLLVVLASFIYLKEREYRNAAEEIRDGIIEEIERLEDELLKDEVNTAYHQRLSSLYERIGEHKRAVWHSEKILTLEPTVRNEWSDRDLKERLRERKHKPKHHRWHRH